MAYIILEAETDNKQLPVNKYTVKNMIPGLKVDVAIGRQWGKHICVSVWFFCLNENA